MSLKRSRSAGPHAGPEGRQPGLDVKDADGAHLVSITRLGFFVAILQPLPQHFLYFLPLPHGQGSLRPTFGSRMSGLAGTYSAGTGSGGGDTGT
jgi:hypothetical protein